MQTSNRAVKTKFRTNGVIGLSSTNHQKPRYKQEQIQQSFTSVRSRKHSPVFIQSLPSLSRYHHSRTTHFLDRNTSFYPASQPQTLRLTPTSITTQTRAMASDASYLSFLEKANQDPNAGTSKATQSKPEGGFVSTKTVDHNVKEVPDVLKSVDVDYVSDTDEPFEAVVLAWEGAGKGEWPSDEQFRSLISPSDSSSSLKQADIATLSVSSFDPKNQYAAVLNAVRKAASGAETSDVDVKIYRLEIGSTRAEYWVLGLDGKGGRIVGLKARAVES